MCAGCRERAAKATLVRIVVGTQGLDVDEAQRRPGRGAYLHPTYACWQQAAKRRSVERGLRVRLGPVSVLDLPGVPDSGVTA
ncbi:MAG: YlxR family protein [Propionibacteriaceae bacterium]